jgi:Calpain family cysteine protease
MSQVGIVSGRNYWQDLETEEARDPKANRPPDRPAELAECLPDTDKLTARTLDNCVEPSRGAPTLFHAAKGKPDIDIADIGQRSIGDCYLLSALGVLTQTPEGRAHIRDMIRENRDGAGNVLSYTVTLYECTPPAIEPRVATKTEIAVSTSLSYQHASTTRPGVANDRAEMWVAVIEKAYAELKGGFGKVMNGGWPGEAFQALTGKLGTYVAAADYDAARLAADRKANRPVTLSTGRVHKDNPFGLVANHAYMVVGSRTDAKGEVSVLLRNPWGKDHPTPIPVSQLQKYFTYADVGQL